MEAPTLPYPRREELPGGAASTGCHGEAAAPCSACKAFQRRSTALGSRLSAGPSQARGKQMAASNAACWFTSGLSRADRYPRCWVRHCGARAPGTKRCSYGTAPARARPRTKPSATQPSRSCWQRRSTGRGTRTSCRWTRSPTSLEPGGSGELRQPDLATTHAAPVVWFDPFVCT